MEAVKKTPYMTLEDLKEFTLQYGDVYFHPVSLKPQLLFKETILRLCCSKTGLHSISLSFLFLMSQNIYNCAKLAAGAALQLVDSVMTGKVRNGMALVR